MDDSERHSVDTPEAERARREELREIVNAGAALWQTFNDEMHWESSGVRRGREAAKAVLLALRRLANGLSAAGVLEPVAGRPIASAPRPITELAVAISSILEKLGCQRPWVSDGKFVGFDQGWAAEILAGTADRERPRDANGKPRLGPPACYGMHQIANNYMELYTALENVGEFVSTTILRKQQQTSAAPQAGSAASGCELAGPAAIPSKVIPGETLSPEYLELVLSIAEGFLATVEKHNAWLDEGADPLLNLSGDLIDTGRRAIETLFLLWQPGILADGPEVIPLSVEPREATEVVRAFLAVHAELQGARPLPKIVDGKVQFPYGYNPVRRAKCIGVLQRAVKALKTKVGRQAGPASEANGKDDDRRRVGRTEANLRARDVLKGKPPTGKKHWTQRDLAKKIGCGTGQVGKLDAYRAYREEHGLDRPNGARAVSLTESLLASTGKVDDELQRLVDEQQADHEPSPLAPGRRKVRTNKKA